jgi:hypothetical protein
MNYMYDMYEPGVPSIDHTTYMYLGYDWLDFARYQFEHRQYLDLLPNPQCQNYVFWNCWCTCRHRSRF